jgi:hypothetical protein
MPPDKRVESERASWAVAICRIKTPIMGTLSKVLWSINLPAGVRSQNTSESITINKSGSSHQIFVAIPVEMETTTMVTVGNVLLALRPLKRSDILGTIYRVKNAAIPDAAIKRNAG